MNALTPTLTAIPLLPPVPKFLADLLHPAGEPIAEAPIAKEPRGGIPEISYGKRLPEERLPFGYYAFPVRGTPSPGIEDYIRLGGLKGVTPGKESSEGIPQLSSGEQDPKDQLTSGHYAYPVRGTPSPGVDDYTRLGELKGPAVAAKDLGPDIDRPDIKVFPYQ